MRRRSRLELSIQSPIYASEGGPVEGREWRLDGLADQDVQIDERLGGAETYGVAHRLVDCAMSRCTIHL